VSFWSFSKKGFGLVFFKNRVRLVFVLGLGFRFELGFGKLIGGAVGTVGWVSRKPPVLMTPQRADRCTTKNDVYLIKYAR